MTRDSGRFRLALIGLHRPRLSNGVVLTRHFYDKGDENHEGNHEINRVLDDDGDGRIRDVQRRHCRACEPTGDDRRHEVAGLSDVFRDDPRLLEAARIVRTRDPWIPEGQGVGESRIVSCTCSSTETPNPTLSSW